MTEIIIKKMQKCLNVESNSLLMGDVRHQMSKDLLDTLTTVVNEKSDHDKVYYILVYASLDMSKPGHKTIKEKVVLLPVAPPKMLGTILFRVDNKNADATMEWCLPLDIPMLANLPTEREHGGARCLVDAAGIPLANRGL